MLIKQTDRQTHHNLK